MVFVQRDPAGKIVGVYACQQDGYAEEFVENDNPEVLEALAPSSIPTVADYENAIQNLVDSTARERRFRDGVTLASYIGSTIPSWAAEAQAFVTWRDNVWRYSYDELDKFQAGLRPQPTIEQFLDEITRISWPNNSL